MSGVRRLPKKRTEERTMTEMKIVEYIETRKADFVEVVKQSLNSLFKESTQSAIYALGGDKALRDPEVFAERLKAVFGMGAEIILKHILADLKKHDKTH